MAPIKGLICFIKIGYTLHLRNNGLGDVMKKLILAFGLYLIAHVPSYGYGADGHHAVCEIAYKFLTPQAKVKVDALLTDPDYDSLGKACGWPDHFFKFGALLSKFSSDHYINVPRSTVTVTDCYDKTGAVINRCLLGAIERAKYVLKSGQTSTQAEIDQGYPPSPVEALRFLGHWYGDIHQPLHVSYADDKGGNDVHTEGISGCARSGVTKLHTVWDTCIVKDLMQEAGLTDDRDGFGAFLQAQIQPADKTRWENSTPLDWANESYEMATFDPVGYCTDTQAGCVYEVGNETYDNGEPNKIIKTSEKYEDFFGGIVTMRMMQAGVRLAKTLNEIWP